MSEQRHLEFVGLAPFSSTLHFMVDSAKLLTSELLEVAAGIAAHPAAAGRHQAVVSLYTAADATQFVSAYMLLHNIRANQRG